METPQECCMLLWTSTPENFLHLSVLYGPWKQSRGLARGNGQYERIVRDSRDTVPSTPLDYDNGDDDYNQRFVVVF